MSSIDYLATLREELTRTTDPDRVAEITAEIARLTPPMNARAVPAAYTRRIP